MKKNKINAPYIVDALLDLAVETSSITIDPKNARTGHDLAGIAASLRAYGQRRPIVVRRDGLVIVAGNGTFKAATEILHWEYIAAVVVDDDAQTAAAFGIADNRLSDSSHFDEAILADLMLDLRRAGSDLVIGYDQDEVDDLLSAMLDDPSPPGVKSGADLAIVAQEKWAVQSGDVYALRSEDGRVHRVKCGDSTEESDFSSLMNGVAADLLFTGPHYGVDYQADKEDGRSIANDSKDTMYPVVRAALSLARGYIAKKASFYICAPTGPLFYAMGTAILECGYNWSQTIIWVKNALVLGRSRYHNKHEAIFFGDFGSGSFWNKSRTKTTVIQDDASSVTFIDGGVQVDFGGTVVIVKGENLEVQEEWPDVWRFDKPTRSPYHPTTKPEKLIKRAITNSTKVGASVLDCFAGSGSTLLACEKFGRVAYLLELDVKYVAAQIEQWQILTGIDPVLVERGGVAI